MKKLFYCVSILFLLAGSEGSLSAQPQYYNYNTNGSNNSFPFNIATGKDVQLLYLPGDFNQPTPAPAGNIISVFFRIGDSYPLGPWTYTDMTIKMGQSNITTFPTGSFYTGALTTVYYRSSVVLTGTAGQWMTITLDNPFAYDPTQSLIVDVGQCAVLGAVGYSTCYTNLSGNRRNWSVGGCPFAYSGQNGAIYNMGLNIVTTGLPVVVTIAATAVTNNSAGLNGTVNANNSSTAVTFEYGLTTAYGTVVPGNPGTVTGNTITPVSANLTGLLPGSTYHYRVDGVNSSGTANGNDMTFTTLSTPYCIPFYSYGCPDGDGVTTFQLGTISQAITCTGSPSYYHDFTSLSTPLIIGMPSTITVQAGYSGTYVTFWIDYNHNNTFDPATETAGGVICWNSNTNYNVSISVPGTSLTGNTRLRVRTEWMAYPSGPCGIQTYGNCSDFTVTIIQSVAPLLLTATHTNVSCFGGSNGSIDLTVTGGTMPYTYLWNNGATTQDLTGLSIGTYSVTVTDLNGLTATSSATITQPGPLVVNDSVTQHILCNGGTGCIAAIASGGIAPYAYHWSNDSTGSSICAHAGIYTITVTDNNQCLATDSINLPQPSSLHINAGENQFVYYGYPPAECATLSWSGASGGVPPYTIQWSTGQTSQTITVCPTVTSTYAVTITDANKCTFSDKVKVCVTDIRCGNNLDKVQICHIPPGNPENRQTLCVAISAVPAHLAHGDSLGACGIDRTCTDDKSMVAENSGPLENESTIKMEAFPNPFSETATVLFTCPAEGYVTIKLVDQIGRVVSTLFADNVGQDVKNQLEVDGSHLSQGLYLVVLQHSDGTTKRIKLICTR